MSSDISPEGSPGVTRTEGSSPAEPRTPDTTAGNPVGGRMQPPERAAATMPPAPDYESLPQEDRDALTGRGITREAYERFQALTKNVVEHGQIQPEIAEEFFRLNSRINNVNPQEAAANIHDMANSGNEDINDLLDPDTESEGARRMREAQAEMNAVMNGEEFDIDRAQQAARSYEEARQHLDREEADDLGKGPSGWYRFWTTLGVAFYLYVGMQYAMAKAVSNLGKS